MSTTAPNHAEDHEGPDGNGSPFVNAEGVGRDCHVEKNRPIGSAPR